MKCKTRGKTREGEIFEFEKPEENPEETPEILSTKTRAIKEDQNCAAEKALKSLHTRERKRLKNKFDFFKNI